jgi:hypothetical protein
MKMKLNASMTIDQRAQLVDKHRARTNDRL